MKTNNKFRIFTIGFIVLFTLTGCLADSGNEAEAVAIEFTNPNGVTQIETPDIVFNLFGKVVSNSEIESVDWANDRGGRGKANGRATFVTGNIILQLGLNNITITATDIDGQSASKSIAVTRENTFAPTSTTDVPTAMYSYSPDFNNSAPVDGATIAPGLVYFFMESGSAWTNKGISHITYLCCEGVSGPGETNTHGPSASYSRAPYTYIVDLSGFPQGGVRRLSAYARFSDGTESNQSNFDFTVGQAAATNRAPTISGTPGRTATVGKQFNFRPVGQDADGDTLRFSIRNQPPWAVFEKSTGRLHGTPTSNNVGNHNNIIISVSDGHASTSLPAFSITVEASGANATTLNWAAPDTRTDNSPLTNLAGFNLYYGQTPGDYANRVQIKSAGIASYVVDNLSNGNWYFVLTALDSSGLESNPSNQIIRSFP